MNAKAYDEQLKCKQVFQTDILIFKLFFFVKIRAKNSDILLCVVDGSTITSAQELTVSANEVIGSLDLKENKKTIFVVNKLDLMDDFIVKNLQKEENIHFISCKTSDGIPKVTEIIANNVTELCSSKNSSSVSFLTERHRTHLLRICESIGEAITSSRFDLSISAHHVRNAINEISSITGDISAEDILDVIFKEFCIGK